ncbi:MAG: Mrp/NBP35 family ATP-binding protein [Chloroflexota bacterium]|nr:Mrp/NBP35 family ATP-binding protein [Dehalococcoidia bacterium]MDW8254217.1 Mrp/NBP35 family ATP-binding protein [Chloroflexota bacterium]
MSGTSQNPLREADVLRALSTVQEPELHKDLVTLNMVRNIRIDGGDVRFTVVLTTPACPLRERIEREARAAVAALPGVNSVTIDFSADVSRRFSRAEEPLLPGVRNVIAVASGKGGVGKSTVAVNLAIALAQAGARVGLLDADIHGPNVPLMMGIARQPVKGPNEKILPPVRYNVRVMSIAFFMTPDTPAIWRGPMVHSAIQQFLRDVEWGELDYLVIDLPPGTGDAALTVAQLLPSARAVIVTTPQDVALLDAGRSLAMFRRLNVPVLGIIENMSYFHCPHCGERTDIFGHGGGAAAAAAQGLKFLGAIAIDPAIRIGGDQGKPVTIAEPESATAASFREVAGQVAAAISVANATEEAPVIIN